MPKMGKLAEREELFAKAYIVFGFNGQAAAQSIGVPAVSSRTWASRALTKDNVQQLIRNQIEALKQRHDLTLDKVIMELKAIGFSNIKNYTRLTEEGMLVIDFENSTEEQLKAVESVSFNERVVKTIGGDDDDEGSEVRSRSTERRVIVNRETKLKLYDKRSALVDLYKILSNKLGHMDGATVIQNNNTINANTVNVSPVKASLDSYNKMLEGS